MNIKEIQEATAKLLGAKVEDVSYITEELMDEYKRTAKEVDTSSGDAQGRKGEKAGAAPAGNWGTYGNTITFDPGMGGKAYWKQGPKGTPNYGCGTAESWSAGKQWASHINYKGRCPDGKNWFFIGNYNG